MKAVVIGAGSVGYSHLAYAINRWGYCGVVDPNEQTLDRAKAEFGNSVKTFPTLTEVFSDTSFDAGSVFFVSNLGPDHMTTLRSLLAHGVRKIYLEKPMAVSISDCQDIVDLQREFTARVVIGFQRRQSGLAETVANALRTYGDSPPVSIVVHGGAMDMSTNGIHWLDFAADVFGALPNFVTGDGKKQRINPRRNDLFFWDGVLTWSFDGGQRLTLVFDNASSVSSSVIVYSRNAIVELNADVPVVRTRDAESVQRYPQVTRHGPASEVVSLGEEITRIGDGRAKLLDLLEGDSDLELALVESSYVTSALWAGLWALENREGVSLPVGSEHPAFRVAWDAS